MYACVLVFLILQARVEGASNYLHYLPSRATPCHAMLHNDTRLAGGTRYRGYSDRPNDDTIHMVMLLDDVREVKWTASRVHEQCMYRLARMPGFVLLG